MRAPFEYSRYIMAQSGTPGEHSFTDPAPLFRKRFSVSACKKATIHVVGLGYGRFYLNGQEITQDRFLSAVSDYRRNIWYHSYDVTELISEGENVAGVICGNGFCNESFDTPWHHNKSQWRDFPKFLLSLDIDGNTVLASDQSWVCTTDSFIPYNQLRSGEIFDARKYDPAWTTVDFDDSSWTPVVLDDNAPTGTLMECTCQPIREFEWRKPEKIIRIKDAYVVDFGKNMAGYARITVKQNAGDRIVLKYGEEYLPDEERIDNNQMDTMYPQVPFQVDTLICSGGVDTYQPYFTYHGFRYVQIEGLKELPEGDFIRAAFVHQDIARTSEFNSSDELLNFIYTAGIRSTYSNLHYALTDCPTREKLGWTNDAQATAEQTLINFDIMPFYRKWYTDILLSVEEDGTMPGIVPSPQWGLDCGPVCDCLLYELPYRVYLYTGDATLLKQGLPYFKVYMNGLECRLNNDFYFWLGDWTGHDNSSLIPKPFVLSFYLIKAMRVTLMAEELCRGDEVEDLRRRLDEKEQAFLATYLDKDGYATVEEQTTLAIMICNGLYRDFEKLKEQLLRTVERDGYRLTCGMVGVQYLYDALALCNASDRAYRIITESDPGYRLWYRCGATTLWERWDGVHIHSHNHHMFSNVLGWFYKGILGIEPQKDAPGFEKIDLRPQFVSGLEFCSGEEETVRGKISVEWKREGDEILCTVQIPKDITATLYGEPLPTGVSSYRIHSGSITRI